MHPCNSAAQDVISSLRGLLFSPPPSGCCAQATALVLRLKALAHKLEHEVTKADADVQAAKAQSDSTALTCAKAHYKRDHLKSEARAIPWMSSINNIEVSLVSMDFFLQNASATMRASLNPLSPDHDHQLNLCRLAFELQLRKTQQEKIQSLKAKVKALSEQRASKMKTLESLQSRLTPIQKTCDQIRPFIKGISDFNTPQDPKINLLPTPLYILAKNFLVATKTHFENQFQIDILGDVSTPLTLQSREGTSKKVTKNPIRVFTAEPITPESIYTAHPLYLLLSYNTQNNSKQPFSIEFHYLQHLHLITVRPTHQSHIPLLLSLFEGDDGVTSPSISTRYIAPRDLDFTNCEVGRPYCWAQWLVDSSIDCVPPPLPLSSSDTSNRTQYTPKANAASILGKIKASL
ncbi:THO complex subunit 5B [Pelomyxa schiedti]|nr:THO complex subunit 5B [Pelomyxa schiedti]